MNDVNNTVTTQGKRPQIHRGPLGFAAITIWLCFLVDSLRLLYDTNSQLTRLLGSRVQVCTISDH